MEPYLSPGKNLAHPITYASYPVEGLVAEYVFEVRIFL